MIPMALLTLLAIYLVYLRRVPRTVGETGRSKKECVRLLLRSLWSLLLAIAVIIVFSLPTWAVVAAIAAVNALVEKFSAQEVRDALVKGFDLKSLLGITMTYVFKDLLVLSGVIDVLPTYFEHLPIPAFLVLLCKQAAKNFHTICKKETALKRVLSNLLSAVSLLRFKAVFSCGFRVPPGSGLYQSCAAGSVCIPAGQKYCSPRPRKSCPADRKTPGLPSRCIGHRW